MRKDITGQKFGRLTAVRFDHIGKSNGRHHWAFVCECGTEHVTSLSNVSSGTTQSCGCYRRELGKKRIAELNTNYKHGLGRSPFYGKWQTMRSRCANKESKSYRAYGYRGIRVCEKWLSFQGFREDMYSSYIKHVKKYGVKDTTLDRIDVNKNYEINNCKWSSIKEQQRNRRNNNVLTIDGKSKCFSEWCEEYSIKYTTAFQRIYTYGWDVERAFTTPTKCAIKQQS